VKNRTGAKSTNKGNAKVDSENASDRWRMFFLRWQHRIEDLVIILMGVLTIVSILGLLDLTEGELINPWVQFIKKWLGWGVWIVPVATGYIVIWLEKGY
jgi:hypothetical protein